MLKLRAPTLHRFSPALALALAVGLLLTAASACAQESKFDGDWAVSMTCPVHDSPDDPARGYTQQFPAEVRQGRLRATHGTEGEPGWHALHGRIQEDGSALLDLDGSVNNPAYAIKDAPRGKPYSYRVKAQFEQNTGTGRRMSGRSCEFTFARR